MLFNSLEFGFFLPLVFSIYWLIGSRNIRIQNAFLLVSSYFFYGWWDYRFLLLIGFSSLIDYVVGMQLSKRADSRKFWLALSIVANLGMLGFFKYYDFFVQSFAQAFSLLGYSFHPTTLGIILPVGISFYTFQTLSYTFDVYRGKFRVCEDPIAFFAYVSFFPQLVAGPIERASHLLPQFRRSRQFTFESGRDGLRQLLWGLFKKVVVADTCAIYADEIFANPEAYGSGSLLIGALCFTFQIYGDFSGYSDMAIGTARLFGFELVQNFRYPYFSKSIAEFWKRWHISLSSWFKTYLYIPLGGNKKGRYRTLMNVVVVFLVSGFWHGANWTFLLWGGLHALYFVPLLLMGKNKVSEELLQGANAFKPVDGLRMLLTFTLVVLGWIFFRAETIQAGFSYVAGIAAMTSGELEGGDYLHLALIMLVWEWLMRKKAHGLDFSPAIPVWFRWSGYLFLIGMILYWFGEEKSFIYFQF